MALTEKIHIRKYTRTQHSYTVPIQFKPDIYLQTAQFTNSENAALDKRTFNVHKHICKFRNQVIYKVINDYRLWINA